MVVGLYLWSYHSTGVSHSLNNLPCNLHCITSLVYTYTIVHNYTCNTYSWNSTLACAHVKTDDVHVYV